MTSELFKSRFDVANMTREEVLGLSNPDRLVYFKEVHLFHPKIEAVERRLGPLVNPHSPTDVVIFAGPTGVGKTTLSKELVKRRILARWDEIQSDPGIIPAVYLAAEASGEKVFSWRMFYKSWGEALNEPLMDRKVETIESDGRHEIRLRPIGATVGAMRSGVTNALVQRKTDFVMIDEAVPIIRNGQGLGRENAMDALKSLANTSGVTLGLIGSYDLLKVVELNAQVSRR